MLKAILEGVMMGMFLALLIGPVFFSLLRTSLNKGFAWGAMFAIGIALSDIIYIVITYTGISQLINNENFKQGLGLIGGAIMIIFGLAYILKKSKTSSSETEIPDAKDKMLYILKGMGMNAISPAVPFFWIGVVGFVTLEAKLKGSEVMVFYIFVITTTFLTDLSKAYLANKLSHIINDKFIHKLNIAAGIGLLIFGVKLLYEVARNFIA